MIGGAAAILLVIVAFGAMYILDAIFNPGSKSGGKSVPPQMQDLSPWDEQVQDIRATYERNTRR